MNIYKISLKDINYSKYVVAENHTTAIEKFIKEEGEQDRYMDPIESRIDSVLLQECICEKCGKTKRQRSTTFI